MSELRHTKAFSRVNCMKHVVYGWDFWWHVHKWKVNSIMTIISFFMCFINLMLDHDQGWFLCGLIQFVMNPNTSNLAQIPLNISFTHFV